MISLKVTCSHHKSGKFFTWRWNNHLAHSLIELDVTVIFFVKQHSHLNKILWQLIVYWLSTEFPYCSLILHPFLSPRDSGGGYSNSGCLSVTLSCLRDNLSKHGWIWIIFCMWLLIIIILDGFLHGNIWSKGFEGKS